MKRAMREYRRIKRAAKIMEGKLDPGIIQSFLDHVDDQVLRELRLKKADLMKLQGAGSEEKMEVLVPYFEQFLESTALDR